MRKVPLKNYIILFFVSVATIILVFYVNAWARAYKEDKLSISPLSSVLNEVGPEEITQTLSETNEVILYIGYNNSQKLYDSENNLLDIYVKNGKALEVIKSTGGIVRKKDIALLNKIYELE